MNVQGVGVGPEELKFTSVPVMIDVGGESISNVSAGTAHSVALTFQVLFQDVFHLLQHVCETLLDHRQFIGQGGIYAWGANQEGQLGKAQ